MITCSYHVNTLYRVTFTSPRWLSYCNLWTLVSDQGLTYLLGALLVFPTSGFKVNHNQVGQQLTWKQVFSIIIIMSQPAGGFCSRELHCILQGKGKCVVPTFKRVHVGKPMKPKSLYMYVPPPPDIITVHNIIMWNGLSLDNYWRTLCSLQGVVTAVCLVLPSLMVIKEF